MTDLLTPVEAERLATIRPDPTRFPRLDTEARVARWRDMVNPDKLHDAVMNRLRLDSPSYDPHFGLVCGAPGCSVSRSVRWSIVVDVGTAMPAGTVLCNRCATGAEDRGTAVRRLTPPEGQHFFRRRASGSVLAWSTCHTELAIIGRMFGSTPLFQLATSTEVLRHGCLFDTLDDARRFAVVLVEEHGFDGTFTTKMHQAMALSLGDRCVARNSETGERCRMRRDHEGFTHYTESGQRF